MKKFLIVLAVFCALIFVVGCGGDSKHDNDSVTNFGKLGYECYPNKTCDEGLICDTGNNVCIEDTENQPMIRTTVIRHLMKAIRSRTIRHQREAIRSRMMPIQRLMTVILSQTMMQTAHPN